MAQRLTIQLGCHLGGLAADTLEDAIGTAARLGFRAVDLPISLLNARRLIGNPGGEASAIRTLLNDFNLTLTDVDWPLPDYNAPDPDQRETAFAEFESILPFIQALRTPGVSISTGGLQPDGALHSMARSAAGVIRLQRSFASMLPNTRLSVCPQVDNAALAIPDVLKLLDCAPGLQLTLDIGFGVYLGLSRKEIAALLNRAAHIRIHQATKNRLQTATTAGSIDFHDLIDDLAEADYGSTLSIAYLSAQGEHGATRLDPIEETVFTRDALRNARASLARS